MASATLDGVARHGNTQHASFHAGDCSKSLSGWPSSINTKAAWTGSQFTNSNDDFLINLTAHDIVEVENALQMFHDSGCDGSEIGVSTFILPTLSKKLQHLAEQLHTGIGFFILRGLDIDAYSAEDNALIFLGISSYIGDRRGIQNTDKEVFTHIREAKKMHCSQHNRPLKDSSLALTFHNDSFCDIFAMHTHAQPEHGGRHTLASTANVFNKLATSRPDILTTLERPDWAFDPRSPHALAGQRSILYRQDDRIMLHFAREPLVGLHKDSDFKVKSTVSEEQMEALDAIELIARHDMLTLPLKPGDMTFVNNFSVIHSRESWKEDQNEKTSSRYVVRVWLKNPTLAWKLPPALQRGNDAVFGLPDSELQWNVLPLPRTNFKIQELFGP